MQETVDLWRESSPRICELWRALEKAAIRSVARRTTAVSTLGNVRFDFEQGVLWMTLPSGRRLAYYGAKYEESAFHPDRKSLTYMGVDQQTKRWSRVETWGGKLVENLVQATARDLLREAMFSLDEHGFDIRAHVHDEVICTEPIDGRSVDEMSRLMCPETAWAKGLPLRADGYEGKYYFKD
jgi:DNA polymerase